MTRHCARPGCAHHAVATLEYDYRGQTAWLHRLSPEPHPMTHDLCADHAGRLSLPRGWRLDDLRRVAPLLAQPVAVGLEPADQRSYRPQLAS